MTELPWIMLSDPTDDLSPEGFESSNCTLDLNGEFSCTKSYMRRDSLGRVRKEECRTILTQERLQELKKLVTLIDGNAPEEFWEGIVTDSSPGVLSIFEGGRIVRTFCFFEFSLIEPADEPAKKAVIEIIKELKGEKDRLICGRESSDDANGRL